MCDNPDGQDPTFTSPDSVDEDCGVAPGSTGSGWSTTGASSGTGGWGMDTSIIPPGGKGSGWDDASVNSVMDGQQEEKASVAWGSEAVVASSSEGKGTGWGSELAGASSSEGKGTDWGSESAVASSSEGKRAVWKEPLVDSTNQENAAETVSGDWGEPKTDVAKNVSSGWVPAEPKHEQETHTLSYKLMNLFRKHEKHFWGTCITLLIYFAAIFFVWKRAQFYIIIKNF